jgi:hypothetical protein
MKRTPAVEHHRHITGVSLEHNKKYSYRGGMIADGKDAVF